MHIESSEILHPFLVGIEHVALDPFDGTCCSSSGLIEDAPGGHIMRCGVCGTLWYRDSSDGRMRRQVVMLCQESCEMRSSPECLSCPMLIKKKYPCRA